MTPPPSQEIVLDGPGISRALERMAHGIVARFPGEPLAIVGLLSQGDVIARRLVDKVKELGVEAQYGAIDISLYRDDIFKLEARPSLRSSNLPFSTDDMRGGAGGRRPLHGPHRARGPERPLRLRPPGPH